MATRHPVGSWDSVFAADGSRPLQQLGFGRPAERRQHGGELTWRDGEDPPPDLLKVTVGLWSRLSGNVRGGRHSRNGNNNANATIWPDCDSNRQAFGRPDNDDRVESFAELLHEKVS
jgi:hypothetical protein